MDSYDIRTIQAGIEEYLKQFEFETVDEKLAETIREGIKSYLDNYTREYNLVVSVIPDVGIKVQLKFDVLLDFIVRKKEKKVKVKILRNIAQCRICGDTIESTFRHDFVRCSCGAIFVDGGTDYLRRGGEFNNCIDMSVTTEIE